MRRTLVAMVMRFFPSVGNHFSHMTLGTLPNMVPPSRRKLPQLMTSMAVPRLVVMVVFMGMVYHPGDEVVNPDN